MAVEAGIFAFLLLVTTSSAVAELHGRDAAERLVILGFVPLIASTLLAMLVLQLPAAHDMPADRQSAFATIMGSTPRIWIGGIIAYGISTLLNVYIFSRLKAREGARMMWLRAGIASVLSQIVDTLIFITISFYGVFPIANLLLGQMLAKVVLSALLVPLADLRFRRHRASAGFPLIDFKRCGIASAEPARHGILTYTLVRPQELCCSRDRSRAGWRDGVG